MKYLSFASLSVLLTLIGCVSQEKYDYQAFRSSSPKSILVVPVVNNTVEVLAGDLFLCTIPQPLAERGYYVFPVNLVKETLEDEGLNDSHLVHQADPARLAEIFGADAVLYISIEQWTAKYVVVNTTVEVDFKYLLKDGKSGQTLWRHRQLARYSTQQGNSGNVLADLVAGAIIATVEKAFPEAKLLQLTRQANGESVSAPYTGVPHGPYSAEYGKDTKYYPEAPQATKPD